MKKLLSLLFLPLLFVAFFSSCGSDHEEKDDVVLSAHITDMQSFTWKRLELINDKYMFLASYADNEDYRNIPSADVVFFIRPVIDCKSPVGKYTITSASFLARKNGYKWFEFSNNDNCGTMEVTQDAQGYKAIITMKELSDRNEEYVKNLTLTYKGKIVKSSMLEY